nr:hypothetical protein [Tanacetum cinerariifolium]
MTVGQSEAATWHINHELQVQYEVRKVQYEVRKVTKVQYEVRMVQYEVRESSILEADVAQGGTVSFVTSVSRSTTLEGEEVVGIVDPLYAFSLRVVIPFKSSFGLVMVLLGSVPELEDEVSQLAVKESGLAEPELGNPGLDKPVLDKLEAGFDHD